MPRKGDRKRLCKRGHNTFVSGRTKNRECKICNREYRVVYYKKHRKAIRRKSKKYRVQHRIKVAHQRIRHFQTRLTKRKLILHSYKDKPCMDCGVQYPPYIMQFDHRPRTKKLFNIGPKICNVSVKALIKEIKKCDLVCANCHFERTYQRNLKSKGGCSK